ncbi:MAG: hypothetical protein QGF98_05200, partial [Candidatus Poseidoniia archaeon]|nr:hypothetical protein [Candidatus Poseidoniia archaeon]
MRNIKFVFPLRFLILLSIIILLSGSSEAATERDPEYTFSTGDGNPIYSTISDDGRYMATVGGGGKVYYHDVYNHTELWSYDTGNDNLYDLDISSDGAYIVAATGHVSGGASFYLFDRNLTGDEELWQSSLASYEIYDVSISANGKTIAVSGGSSGGYRLYVFDISSSTPLWQTSDDCDSYCVATNDVSSDGSYIVTQSNRHIISGFSVSSPTPLWTKSVYMCCEESREENIKISWDNKYVIAATKALTYDKILTINLTSGNVESFYTSAYTGSFESISIARDSKTFAASHSSGRIFLFNMTVNTPFQTITHTGNNPKNLDLSGNGKFLVVVDTSDDLYLYDIENNVQLWYNDNNWHRYDRAGPKISINGRYIAIGGSGQALLYNNSAASGLSIFNLISETKVVNPPEFKWIGTNDNLSNLKFDVYLDGNTNPTTKVASNISLSSYTASGLTEGNTYYWKVVAWNSSSNYSILGPNKITVNKAPILSDFTPEDNKKWYSESAVLSWSASDADGDSLTYDVYLYECDPDDYPEEECPDEIDPSSKVASGITATQHTETGLTTNNTIFWKVVAKDGYNTTSSSILKFQIKPKYHDWRATTGSQTYVSPSVSGDGRFILLGSDDDEIQFFDY